MLIQYFLCELTPGYLQILGIYSQLFGLKIGLYEYAEEIKEIEKKIKIKNKVIVYERKIVKEFSFYLIILYIYRYSA
jgi:hypothetical protein